MYSIIVCNGCGRLILAKMSQRSRRCPHCDVRINTERARLVVSAATAREASELLRTLKRKRE